MSSLQVMTFNVFFHNEHLNGYFPWMSLTLSYAGLSGYPILYGVMNPQPNFYVLLLLGGISAYYYKTTLTFRKFKKK